MIGDATILWSISILIWYLLSHCKHYLAHVKRWSELLEFGQSMIVGPDVCDIPFLKLWKCLTSLNLKFHVCTRNTRWKTSFSTMDSKVTNHWSLMIVTRVVWLEISAGTEKQHWLRSYSDSMQVASDIYPASQFRNF